MLAKIARTFKCSVYWLLTGEKEESPPGAATQGAAAGQVATQDTLDPDMLKVIVRVIAEYERDCGVIIDPPAKAELTVLLCQIAGRLDDRSEGSVARAVVSVLKRAA